MGCPAGNFNRYDMASQHIGSAVLLIAATVGIHGGGTVMIFWILFRIRTHAEQRFGFAHNTLVLTIVILALLSIHFAEVAVWAALYSYLKCFRDFSTSLYFSLASYSTVGYGDVVLSNPGWRLLGGTEALTGSLMLCWSTVILVQTLTWVYTRHVHVWEKEGLVARGGMRRPDPRR
jgi:voltage-gated potassium channel